MVKQGRIMTYDERWLQTWQKYMDFMAEHKRRPSKYKKEDMSLVNWDKRNRKLFNKGLFPQSRMEKYMELRREAAKCHHINQFD